MKRKLFPLCAVLSLLLCVGVLLAYTRRYRVCDTVYLDRERWLAADVYRAEATGVRLAQGRWQFVSLVTMLSLDHPAVGRVRAGPGG